MISPDIIINNLSVYKSKDNITIKASLSRKPLSRMFIFGLTNVNKMIIPLDKLTYTILY
jgi:hypothetical protein